MRFLIEDTNKIDMHIHTNYSDGSFEPREIIQKAKRMGLKYISFTDHNIDCAKNHCGHKGDINVIPGCEISVDFNGKTLHLLAYKYSLLFNVLVLPKIFKMRVNNERYSLKRVCKLIHEFGGVAIIAHPFKYNCDGEKLIKEVLNEKCIDGIECIHAYHTQKEIDYLLDICNENDLIVSAGSDFHYCNRNIRNVGIQNTLTQLPVSNSTIEEQLKRAKKKYNMNTR